ncbi:hypothetical protein BB561_001337 [Smittium simulii]|uniref:polynucleotide adenylyltransferase n=1 Tax=Smittium simulii TaxID=133385 RepID=A0A2T9YV16_9FUNG|nr:hypothetical protein BB561_001337 [Smittium simulii]
MFALRKSPPGLPHNSSPDLNYKHKHPSKTSHSYTLSDLSPFSTPQLFSARHQRSVSTDSYSIDFSSTSSSVSHNSSILQISNPPSKHQRSKSFFKALSLEQEEALSEQIYQLNDLLSIDEQSTQLKNHFMKKIEKLIRAESSASGLASRDSDLDICLLTESEVFSNILQLNSVFLKYRFKTYCIPNARVPIVKLWDPQLKISADININSTIGLHNTEMIKLFISIDSRVKPFIIAIKHWTKQRDLNDAAFGGTLSPYAWVNMAIFFLQTRTPPVLPVIHPHESFDHHDGISFRDRKPNLQFNKNIENFVGFGNKNTDSIGKLLFDFFKHFGFDFDYANQVISVRNGEYISKAQKGWHIGRPSSIICIEEPFSTWLNLAHGVNHSSAEGIKNEFIRAHNIMANNGQLKSICKSYKPGIQQKTKVCQSNTSIYCNNTENKKKIPIHKKFNEAYFNDVFSALPLTRKSISNKETKSIKYVNSATIFKKNKGTQHIKPKCYHHYSLSTDTLVSSKYDVNNFEYTKRLSPLPQSPKCLDKINPFKLPASSEIFTINRLFAEISQPYNFSYISSLNLENIKSPQSYSNDFNGFSDNILRSKRTSDDFKSNFTRISAQSLVKTKKESTIKNSANGQTQSLSGLLEYNATFPLDFDYSQSNHDIKTKELESRMLDLNLISTDKHSYLSIDDSADNMKFINYDNNEKNYDSRLSQPSKTSSFIPLPSEPTSSDASDKNVFSTNYFNNLLGLKKINLNLENEKQPKLESRMYYNTTNSTFTKQLNENKSNFYKTSNTSSRLHSIANSTKLESSYRLYNTTILNKHFDLQHDKNVYPNPSPIVPDKKEKICLPLYDQSLNSTKPLQIYNYSNKYTELQNSLTELSLSLNTKKKNFRRGSLPPKLSLSPRDYQYGENLRYRSTEVEDNKNLESRSYDLKTNFHEVKSAQNLCDLDSEVKCEIYLSSMDGLYPCNFLINDSSDHLSDCNSFLDTGKTDYFTPLQSPNDTSLNTGLSEIYNQ